MGARYWGHGPRDVAYSGPLTCHGRKMKHSGEYIRLGYHPSSSVSARLVKK